VICPETKNSFIIDPGGSIEKIKKALKNTNPIYIINTHGHIDHIKENQRLKEIYNLAILIHKDDAHMLQDPQLNLSSLIWGERIILERPTYLLEDNQILEIGNLKIKVIHTPGHTPGGCCFLVENREREKILFSGDTLFNSSIGRTDLYGGSLPILIKSIKEKIFSLEEDIEIYPGHGPMTNIKREKLNNPYLKNN
jgi:glyoxylase-like metal-dependent hydrolase (beta-lactamase superfamily II)